MRNVDFTMNCAKHILGVDFLQLRAAT